MKTGRSQCCSGCWCSSGRVVLSVVYLVSWHSLAFWLLIDCSSFCETLWVWQRIASAAKLAIQDFLSLLLHWLFNRSLSWHNGLLFSALSRLDQCVSVGMDPTQLPIFKDWSYKRQVCLAFYFARTLSQVSSDHVEVPVCFSNNLLDVWSPARVFG